MGEADFYVESKKTFDLSVRFKKCVPTVPTFMTIAFEMNGYLPSPVTSRDIVVVLSKVQVGDPRRQKAIQNWPQIRACVTFKLDLFIQKLFSLVKGK